MLTMSDWRNRVLFCDPAHANLGAAFLCQVLAPGDHLHLQRLAETRNPLPKLAEAEQPERLAVQPFRHVTLPSA